MRDQKRWLCMEQEVASDWEEGIDGRETLIKINCKKKNQIYFSILKKSLDKWIGMKKRSGLLFARKHL